MYCMTDKPHKHAMGSCELFAAFINNVSFDLYLIYVRIFVLLGQSYHGWTQRAEDAHARTTYVSPALE